MNLIDLFFLKPAADSITDPGPGPGPGGKQRLDHDGCLWTKRHVEDCEEDSEDSFELLTAIGRNRRNVFYPDRYDTSELLESREMRCSAWFAG